MPPAPSRWSQRQFDQPENLVDLILRAAHGNSRSGIYDAPGSERNDAVFSAYPAVLSEAQRILRGLRKRVGSAGAKVALLLEQPRDFIPAFWACVLGGYVPCPLVPIFNDPERWAKHLAHVNTLLDRPLFVTTSHLGRELPPSLASAELTDLRSNTADEDVHRAERTDVAILVLTSGSTGNAKAVALTHGNILASMAGKAECQQLTATDITLNWISFDHVAALLEAHLLPLYVGATQLHAAPAVILSDPLSFLRLIDSFRVSMTFTPNFLLAQINSALQADTHRGSTAGHPNFDLSCLRHIISGGEAIVVDTGRRFLELLAPHGLSPSALWPAFGMTETCAGSVYSRGFPGVDVGSEFACLGLPISGLHIRVADSDDVALPPGQPGELQLRGPMVFSHYHNNEAATLAAFTSDGWFRSGDVGRIDNGRLSLVGRNKDSIIVNGVNYFSHELETALERLRGVERSFVAAFPTRPKGVDTEQLVVIFATSIPPSDEAKLFQLVTAVRNTTIMLWGFRPAIILPLATVEFPKTSLGKIQRALLRRRLEAGEFADQEARLAGIISRQLGPYTPPANPLESSLAALFAEMFGIAATAVSTTSSFFDLGGTSLDILKLTHSLERQFDLKATLPIVLQNPTVRKLAAHVAARSQQESEEYDPIVPLQVTGTKTPLFCIHPGNGEVLILVNLAKYFVNERPFYALRPRGFNRDEECFETWDEMVETYLGAIVGRQPSGPYAIAGYSLGAPVAFEIAKRIEAMGEHVAFLGCIDGPPCKIEPPFDKAKTATGLAALLELIEWKHARELEEQLRTSLSDRDPCESVIEIASRKRLAELDLDLPKFSAWVRVAQALENILRSNVTSGTVRTMSIFYSEGFAGASEAWHNRIKQWDNFVNQPAYINVPGEHYTLMAPKHVAVFQELLRAEINCVLQEQ